MDFEWINNFRLYAGIVMYCSSLDFSENVLKTMMKDSSFILWIRQIGKIFTVLLLSSDRSVTLTTEIRLVHYFILIAFSVQSIDSD